MTRSRAGWNLASSVKGQMRRKPPGPRSTRSVPAASQVLLETAARHTNGEDAERPTVDVLFPAPRVIALAEEFC